MTPVPFFPPPDFFEEAELADPAEYVRMKHSREFDGFQKQILPDGRILFTYDNGSISYSYEFTEI